MSGEGSAAGEGAPPTRRRVLPLAALLLLGLAAAACASTTHAAASGRVAGPTTTAAVPARADAPLSVVVAGDSVMDDLAEALVPALHGGGTAVVSHTWLLGLTRDTASRLEMERTVAEADPDVVVVLMGVWELDPLESILGTPGWERRYDREVLDPFVDLVTARGAQVLWLGMPATADPTVTTQLAELDRVYAALARRDPRVWFLDVSTLVDGPGGTYAERLPGPDATTRRVRQTDGLHFCPAGTVLAVSAVLDRLVERWDVAVADGWEAGSWRAAQGVEDGVDRCPDD